MSKPELKSFSEETGFEDDAVRENKDIKVAEDVLDRASTFRGLVEHPAWKFLDTSLKNTQKTLLDELSYCEDTNRIKKLQAIILVLKIFPTYIEHVFIDAKKAIEILESLKA